jgi:hypothetical protein
MRAKSILFFIIIILCISDCTKDKYVYYVKETLKPWAFFKKGSYWIFYNENNGSINSNYISEKEDIYYYPDSPPQYENIYLNISSDFITRYLLFRDKDEASYLSIGFNFNASDPLKVLSTSVIEGSSNVISNTCRLIKVHETLTINGNKFNNVIQTQDTSVYSYGNKVTVNFYFVKNIGLVKQETSYQGTDTIISLLRWHVWQ